MCFVLTLTFQGCGDTYFCVDRCAPSDGIDPCRNCTALSHTTSETCGRACLGGLSMKVELIRDPENGSYYLAGPVCDRYVLIGPT